MTDNAAKKNETQLLELVLSLKSIQCNTIEQIVKILKINVFTID